MVSETTSMSLDSSFVDRFFSQWTKAVGLETLRQLRSLAAGSKRIWPLLSEVKRREDLNGSPPCCFAEAVQRVTCQLFAIRLFSLRSHCLAGMVN
jgi:hypothetical protein